MSKEIVDLKHPITINGAEVKQLEMRRPKVRDMLTAQKGKGTDADREVLMFANLCEQTPAVIEELDMADYQQLQETYSGFLNSPKTAPGR